MKTKHLDTFSRREFVLLSALGAVGMFTTGCSGIANDSALTNTTWIDALLGEERAKFSNDGTVHIGDDSYPWKQDGDKVIVTRTLNIPIIGRFIGEIELTFELGEQDGYKTLSDLTDVIKAFYVPEDKLDSAREYIGSHAEHIDFDQLTDDNYDNEARAKETYEGKFWITTTTVRSIESDYATCSDWLYKGLPANAVNIYLPSETLTQLNPEDSITVCGLFTAGSSPSITGFLVTA